MNIADITPENVAKAVGGKIERDGSILCCCPIHEASGTHNPSLVLSITNAQRILFHCRSQNCDAKHFHIIRNHLVEKCGLPRSQVGGSHGIQEIRYTYQHPDGSYAWTKTRYATKSGKKRFRCEVWDETAKQWSTGRPEGMPLLFNLAAVANVLTTYPTTPLLIVEGERDVLSLLATRPLLHSVGMTARELCLSSPANIGSPLDRAVGDDHPAGDGMRGLLAAG